MSQSRALPFTERLRLLRLLAGRGAVELRAALAFPVYKIIEWRTSAPERLLISPQDIRIGDPTIAADIYAGYFTFAGKVVNCHGYSPFAIEPPSAEWARVLCGFSWLRHLRAAETALARANARALVKEFIALHGYQADHRAWTPDVAARRALSWLSQSPMLLEGVEYEDYRRFIGVLSQGHQLLRRCIAKGLSGETQLTAAAAMTCFALCAQGPGGKSAGAQLKSAAAILSAQLKTQILPDGGPLTRNPQTLLDLLFDLLPLRQAFAARGLPPPPALLNAIDRMTPALRMFRHGDGALALFNGMGVTAPDRIATLLAYQDPHSTALANAPYSGYQRLEAGDFTVIVDVGAPPPPLFSRAAHAGCLSFEFSFGRERLVVNCGAPSRNRPDLRASARTTAAHSTLTLADRSSNRIAGNQGLERHFAGEILSGPASVTCARDEHANEVVVTARHDGYRQAFGLLHERRLSLRRDGAMLSGRDRLLAQPGEAPGDIAYALRFHLHPAVMVSPVENERAALLHTPAGLTLIFEAGGLPVTIEESIFFAAPQGPRACTQLVVHGDAADIAEITWCFRLQKTLA